jgi:galactokinase
LVASNRTRWLAPGRVTLIGDHTDYTGGFVLPFAIELATSVAISLDRTGVLRAESTLYAGTVHRRPLADLAAPRGGWVAYVEGAVYLLREQGVAIDGVTVTVDGNLPAGAGLSASAALVCATLCALLEATGHEVDRLRVARLAQRVENEYIGAPVGFMDPAVVMVAEAGHALLIDCWSQEMTAVPLDLEANGLELLVVDTGERHRTGGATYRERVAQCRAAADLLGVTTLREVRDQSTVELVDDPILRSRARHVVSENVRVLEVVKLLRAGRLPEVGPHLVASHTSLRDDYGVSTPALDLVVDSALDLGALGARLTGAGLGGCVVALAPRTAVARITGGVQKALADKGSPVSDIRVVHASSGAHRAPVDADVS